MIDKQLLTHLTTFDGTISIFPDNTVSLYQHDKSVYIATKLNSVVDITTKEFIIHKQGDTRYKTADSTIIMPEVTDSFILTKENLDILQNKLSENLCYEILICRNDEKISFNVVDSETLETKLSLDVSTTITNYSIFIKADNFRLFPGSYTVNLTKKSIVQFKNIDNEYVYYIAPNKPK